ncbi:MAG: helix-turn-helix transcriptional regulator [Clostridia bacterium]|nr:helix-turn-helix transcriptional regulator [Clostridia bacterium]
MVLPKLESIGIYCSENAEKNTVYSKRRITKSFEVELPLEDGGLLYLDHKTRPITPDLIVCVKPGQQRHTKFPFRCYYVHMTVEKGPLWQILMNAPDFFVPADRERYVRIFAALDHHARSLDENKELILQSLILELIYTIGKEGPPLIAGSVGNRRAVDAAVQYIKANLTEKLSLDQVAEVSSLSPIYFHKIFRAAMGQSLRRYVEELRIKRAMELLTSSNSTLAEIAYECGFSSQSYFSYVFKRRMKMTPREYVREIYEKYER